MVFENSQRHRLQFIKLCLVTV